jgi:hypothetical protein
VKVPVFRARVVREVRAALPRQRANMQLERMLLDGFPGAYHGMLKVPEAARGETLFAQNRNSDGNVQTLPGQRLAVIGCCCGRRAAPVEAGDKHAHSLQSIQLLALWSFAHGIVCANRVARHCHLQLARASNGSGRVPEC